MRRNNRFIEISVKNLAEYLPFIVFSFVFIFGLLVGNLLVGSFTSVNELAISIFNKLYVVSNDDTFVNLIASSFIKTIPMYFGLFLIGTSIIGSVCAPFLIATYGLTYGIVSGYLYMSFKLEGIMFNCLILMPTTIFVVFGLILLSIEAFRFSVSLANICIKFNKPINIFEGFKKYCIKSATTLICAFLGIVFDICLSYLFMNYFNF